jgi:phosphatidylserine/phosphatidylglycerophosphate/cardiolipin synthase-like enzyme
MGLGNKGSDWFESSLNPGISSPNTASSVVAFVDPEELFPDIRAEVEATTPGHFIYWIGFEVDGGTPVQMPKAPPAPGAKRPFVRRTPQDGDKTWFDLLKDAHDRRVQVRALLTLHPSPKDDNREHYKKYNFDLVKKINDELKDAFAINDFRYLWLNGVHHQKLLLVFNDKGLIAYLGTCDLQNERLFNRWCEVTCKYQGATAVQLYDLFVSRWSEHTEVLRKAGKRGELKGPISRAKPSQTDRYIHQLSRTYGNPGRNNPLAVYGIINPGKQVVNQPHRWQYLPGQFVGAKFFTGEDPDAPPYLDDAKKQNKSYGFAPTGETGIYFAIKKAIQNTEKFIYMEDQYLVCDEKMGKLDPILNALVDKVKESNFKKLIILCTRIDDINPGFQFTGWAHRRNFIKSLLDAGKEKVIVCQYKSRDELKTGLSDGWLAPFYIHSKTWFFDDELLICGSANCNRRGYSHDSELDGTVYDREKKFVKDLRIRVWQARLNTEGAKDQKFDLADFLSAAKFWESPPSYGLTIETCGQNVDNFKPIKWPDLNFTKFDLAKSVSGVQGLDWLYSTIKQIGLWNIAVDPEGT